MKKISFSYIVIFIVVLSTTIVMMDLKLWKKDRIICWDVNHYYVYVPATFIYHDLTLYFKKTKEVQKKIWYLKTEDGKRVIKTSMGLAYLYTPAFFVGHAIAKLSDFPADGYSEPYKMVLSFNACLFLFLGLFYLRKFLKKYLNDITVGITLLLIALGTNLFFYATIEPAMSHIYSFTLFAAFLYFIDKYYSKPTIKNSIIIGLLFGLIVLVRPTNIIIGIFFLLYRVPSIKALKERVVFFKNKWFHLSFIILAIIIIWLPQVIYWKIITGSWFYYSYQDEGFFFNNPQIIEGLFGYRKGWFIYTPIMFFATFIGIPILFSKVKDLSISVLLFVVLNIWIILSWWCWWYGGGFGGRAFIDSYAIMAIPLGFFINKILKLKLTSKILIFTTLIFFIYLNLFSTKQYYKKIIHWDSMTKESYWAHFLKDEHVKNWVSLLDRPDLKKALKGIYESIPTIASPTAPGQYTAIQAANNKFLKLKDPNAIIYANSLTIGNNEKFRVYKYKEQQLILQANNNHFMYADKNIDSLIDASSSNPWAWETFEVIQLENNKVALKTDHGFYLSLQPNETIRGNSDTISLNEIFQIIFLE